MSADRSDTPSPEGGPALSTGAVARRLGVAPTTLRSWERRYAIGPARHESGRHRRWTPSDVARLEEMCRLTGLGIPPREAARAALAATLPDAAVPGTARAPLAARPPGHDGTAHDDTGEPVPRDAAAGNGDTGNGDTGTRDGPRGEPVPVAAADATDDWFPLPIPLRRAGEPADGERHHRCAGAPAPPELPPAARAPALPPPAPRPTAARRATGRGASGVPGPTGTGTLRAAEARPDTAGAGEHTAPTPPGATRGDRPTGTADASPHGTVRTEGGGRTVPAARRPVATRTADRSARTTVPARSTDPTRGTGTPAHPAAPRTGPLPHGSTPTAQRLRSLGAHAHPAETRHGTAAEEDATSPRPRPEWRGLAHAATRLDGPAVEHLLDLALARHGLITAWEEVIAPALHTVGRKWAMEGEPYVGVEHLLSWHVSSALRRLPTAPPRTGAPPLLLTCVADEHHTLPIEALAAALGQRGIPTRVFGPAMPADALVGAVRRLGPAGVVLWAQARETADRALVGHLLGVGWGQRGARTRPAVHLAGPGWAGAAVAGATRLTGLRSAVDLLDRTTP